LHGTYHVARRGKNVAPADRQLLAKRWPEVKTDNRFGLAKIFPGPPRALDTSLDIAKVRQGFIHTAARVWANGWRQTPGREFLAPEMLIQCLFSNSKCWTYFYVHLRFQNETTPSPVNAL